MDQPVGSVIYTQLCNDRGGIECDLTATRVADDRYFLVTGTAFGNHDLGWVRKQQDLLAEGDAVTVHDITAAYACLGVWGPRSRDLLAPLTATDLGNEAFPYLQARMLTIGAVPCLALRVTYVGELGWELYCPTEYGAALWDALWDAGAAHGLRAGGYRAIDALRVEKGYRVWSSDITPEDNPYEAGLGFAVKLDKETPFVGREALRRVTEDGPTRRLRCLTLDDPRAVTLGSEPVRVAGEVTGRVTSGGYGFRVDASLAYAYLPAASAAFDTRVDVEVFGEWIGATVVRDSPWDPGGERIRA
jgi:4-methylaminobutanoate oxidase (formaldehyde-forming)